MKRVSLLAATSLLLGALIALPAGTAQSAKQAEGPSGSLPLQAGKWKGDLDGMVKRRTIRALVVNSKTFYFLDKGRQYGASYEGLKAFEKELNKKLKTKTRKVQVYFIPVARDEIIPALLDGRGDIAAANLSITPERQRQADFSTPIYGDASEIVVTGPSSPKIAGVKYIRYMIDRYYADEPMDPLDKGLFAFASYNAGPARVRGLRKEAARRGLDPNAWFNNVEVVAADRIGSETVTYVSNAYKYYIAYKLVTENEAKRLRARDELKKKSR